VVAVSCTVVVVVVVGGGTSQPVTQSVLYFVSAPWDPSAAYDSFTQRQDATPPLDP
jgi:hypothetical protein